MNLKSIITKVGTSLFREAVPGGGLILDTVNAFLPKDKKLGADATGKDIEDAVNTLPPEQRAMVLTKEYDVEIADIESWTSIQQSHSEADQSGHSTRPEIALAMARVVAFAIIAVVSIWTVAVYRGNVETLKVLSDSSMLIFTILATPTVLLRSYFGLRTREKTEQTRAGAGVVPPSNPIAEMIGAWRSK